ncbi:MAG: uracil phosphoribosyltransferase [Erysipelotrichaceae bacterium]|nr:uracil phosphoribosyltransferase [Erysipelotrichaceae bacterium]MCI9313171.1 uracil phosphoribosyltransferase [Erysipelotrichaceae bacterium]
MKQAGMALRFIMTMVLSCVLALLLGLWLDEQLHTSPIFVLGLLLYAIGGSLYMMIKKLGAL